MASEMTALLDSVQNLLVIGGGGHAKVVLDIARLDHRYQLKGLIDNMPPGTLIGGVPVLGDDSILATLFASGICHAHVAIGSNTLRERLFDIILRLGFNPVTFKSRSADLSPSVRLGRGAVVMGGTVINADTDVGDGSIINSNASVDHDCLIGKFAHIAPGSTLAGNVTVGDRSFVGAGVTIIPGVTLGSDVIVGAGACVINDIPSGQTVVGIPAKMKRSS
jgi:UDP-perosamine 4-acetyltransferase